MNDTLLIMRKEWMNFWGSDRGVFFAYGVLIVSYGLLFAAGGGSARTGAIWWVFFSVVASGTFANTVFVAERLNGSLEILLTSGISRDAVLYGKAAFILALAVIMGAVPLALALALPAALRGAGFAAGAPLSWSGPALYLAASLMNIAGGAWLSVRLANPRVLHFINLLILAAVVTVFLALGLPLWLLAAALLGLSAVFFFLAVKGFHSERVVQPVSM